MKKLSRAYAPGFIALETIAITIVIILVVVVTFAIVFTPQPNTKAPLRAPVDSLPQQSAHNVLNERADVQFLAEDSAFVEDPGGKPVNEKLFDKSKQDFEQLAYPVMQTRFKGRILSIDRSNGLRMQMSSLLENSLGAEVEYYLSPASVAKIAVKDGTLDTLAVGQEINIDETNDYSLSYQESIQAVEISQI